MSFRHFWNKITFFSSAKPKRVTIKDEFMTLDVNHLSTNVNYEDVVTSDNNYEYEESVSKGIFGNL